MSQTILTQLLTTSISVLIDTSSCYADKASIKYQRATLFVPPKKTSKIA